MYLVGRRAWRLVFAGNRIYDIGCLYVYTDRVLNPIDTIDFRGPLSPNGQ